MAELTGLFTKIDGIAVYKGFMKIVDTLNKFKASEFNFSKGVYSTYHEGIMTILTFTEKLEKNVTEFFPFVFDIHPATFKFMDKHFTIVDIVIDDKEIEFLYDCAAPEVMYADKAFVKIKDNIYKKDTYFATKIKLKKSDLYKKTVSIFNSITDMNHKESKEFKLKIYEDIAASEVPLVIDDERFFTRLSKSVFQNVTKGDTALVKCIPYSDEKSSVFLTTTTVNKSEYQIINVFNVLYLPERDE
jgi:hypothetical protein